MGSTARQLDEQAFERLCEHMAVAIVHCSDQQVLDLADSLHAALRRRRKTLPGRPNRHRSERFRPVTASSSPP